MSGGRAMEVIDKDGRKVNAPFIVDGICKNDGKYICNLGYACDGCPYNRR